MLRLRFPDDDVRLFKPRPARFACSCSRERVANALRMIGGPRSRASSPSRARSASPANSATAAIRFDAEDALALFAAARRATRRDSSLSLRGSNVDGRIPSAAFRDARPHRDRAPDARPLRSRRSSRRAEPEPDDHAPAADVARRLRAARHAARPFRARNPHWQHAEAAQSIAIFHGPHAYVSPSWYAEPAAGVPTWNYAVVHAHGHDRARRRAAPAPRRSSTC